MTLPLLPNGQRGIVRHNGNLGAGGVVTCAKCGEMYDGRLIDFCPYCAFSRDVMIAIYEKKLKIPALDT